MFGTHAASLERVGCKIVRACSGFTGFVATMQRENVEPEGHDGRLIVNSRHADNRYNSSCDCSLASGFGCCYFLDPVSI